VMTPLAWLALCIYSWATDQAYMQRVFASRDDKVARFAYLYTAANYLVFGICVAGIGMAASVLVPGLKDQDQAFPSLIANVFPHGLRGFFLTGILATTMSTASAYLAAPSSVFVQDLYEPLMRKRLKHHGLLNVSRISIIFLAGIALVVALRFPGVVNAVVFSTIVAPAAIFFPLMLALYWKRTNTRAGFWAILLAALSGVYSQGYLYGHVHGMLGALHPLFLGPFLGLAVLLIATLLAPARTTEPAPSALLAAAALNADMVEPAHGAQ
jgi:solute:Na+ symporter, SSS family